MLNAPLQSPSELSNHETTEESTPYVSAFALTTSIHPEALHFDDVRLVRKPEAHPGRRMGVVLAAGPIDEARERAQAAAAKVWVS